jgi:hypothetical protein
VTEKSHIIQGSFVRSRPSAGSGGQHLCEIFGVRPHGALRTAQDARVVPALQIGGR